MKPITEFLVNNHVNTTILNIDSLYNLFKNNPIEPGLEMEIRDEYNERFGNQCMKFWEITNRKDYCVYGSNNKGIIIIGIMDENICNCEFTIDKGNFIVKIINSERGRIKMDIEQKCKELGFNKIQDDPEMTWKIYSLKIN